MHLILIINHMKLVIKKNWVQRFVSNWIFFEKNQAEQLKLKKIGATYSKSFNWWYIDYSPTHYKTLKSVFPELIIKQPVAGESKSRDLTPIATRNIQLGLPQLNKSEYKVELPLKEKLRLELLANNGKYWFF